MTVLSKDEQPADMSAEETPAVPAALADEQLPGALESVAPADLAAPAESVVESVAVPPENPPPAPASAPAQPGILTGVFLGVYGLYAVGWIYLAFKGAGRSADGAELFLHYLSAFVAIFSPLIWTACVLRLTESGHWRRWLGLGLGILLLFPWGVVS